MARYVANLKTRCALFIFLCGLLLFCDCHDQFDQEAFEPPNIQKVYFEAAKPNRYLLYDVNQGEGFNLRRDVHMRVANLVKSLNKVEPWILVLPPWGHLYHWQSDSLDERQVRIPWSLFFDTPSLSKHVPVMEFEEFLATSGSKETAIDQIYYLQHYKEGWKNGNFEEKIHVRDCIDRRRYEADDEGKWRGWFFGYHEEAYALRFECLSVQGHARIMEPILFKNTTATSVLIDRAENLLHDIYGETDYWEARRSMVFSKNLRDVGDKFRAEFLNSTDEVDQTEFEDDWTKMVHKSRKAIGGPYIGVHLRRKDYLRAHKEHVPKLKYAAKQIKQLLKKYQVQKVFIASDDDGCVEKITKFLKNYEVYSFEPSREVLARYMDGGVAIIDQWICAHARPGCIPCKTYAEGTPNPGLLYATHVRLYK